MDPFQCGYHRYYRCAFGIQRHLYFREASGLFPVGTAICTCAVEHYKPSLAVCWQEEACTMCTSAIYCDVQLLNQVWRKILHERTCKHLHYGVNFVQFRY